MSDGKHTPEPWRVRLSDIEELFDVFGVGPYGLITLAEGVDIHDARLIAAAPDMLEALRAANEYFDRMEGKGEGGQAIFDVPRHIVQVAIAKAEGRS